MVKFTHYLKFNSVPEWRGQYLAYALLKKLIYKQEKLLAFSRAPVQTGAVARESLDGEQSDALDTPFLAGAPVTPTSPLDFSPRRSWDRSFLSPKLSPQTSSMTVNPELEFVRLLGAERTRLNEFITSKYAELSNQLANITETTRAKEREGALHYTDPNPYSLSPPRVAFWNQEFMTKPREQILPELVDLYVFLTGLKDYVEMNKEGFRKILKKWDKVNEARLSEVEMPLVEQMLDVQRRMQALDEAIDNVMHLYALLSCRGNLEMAVRSMKEHQSEHIRFQRNTVWHDLIALERRTQMATAVRPVDEQPNWWGANKHYFLLLGSLIVFLVLLEAKVFPGVDAAPQRNCLALLVFVSCLWATEAVPLFVTSMLVPLLAVTLRVVVVDGKRLEPPDAATYMFGKMYSQVIMLLLGGFAVAAALSKHNIARKMAIAVLSRVGRAPANVLLATMMVATFLSMWISNVAAPVLCFSLVQPILRTLDTTHSFAKALVMGIALASNVGGMTSPISSPQNIFAIQVMGSGGEEPPSWTEWFIVALPVSVLCNMLIWVLLLLVYQPHKQIKEVRPIRAIEDKFTLQQVVVVLVSLLTVGLWCLNGMLEPYLGSMGVIAILPMVVFFGFGILSKDDFNAFLWNVVMLAMGGLAVGECVKSSQLLQSIATGIQDLTAGWSLYSVMCMFCALVLFCTTFISHTVGAFVILPVLKSVGDEMAASGQPAHSKLLVMAAALMCSGAMGLPVSGFPNMNAVALEDQAGLNYVNTLDFFNVGLLSSAFAYVVIITLGYSLMLLVRF